ncbi:hypothetical protein BKA57DRAFT_447346, partial [Linnemannia elongata]
MSCCCNAYVCCLVLSVVCLCVRACACVCICKKRELSLFDDGVVGAADSGFICRLEQKKSQTERETRLAVENKEIESRASLGHTEPKRMLVRVYVWMPVSASASAEMGGKKS